MTRNCGILGRMRQIIDFYRMLKLIKETGDKEEAEDTDNPNRTSYRSIRVVITAPLLSDFLEKYKKKYSLQDAKNIRNDLINKGYLKEKIEHTGNVRINGVFLTDDGRDFTGRVFGVPWTYIEKLVSSVKQTIAIPSAIIVGVLVGNLATVIHALGSFVSWLIP